MISIDSSDVLMANKDGVTSYTFKTLTQDMSKTTNYILAHDENNNIDEYYLTYENDGSSKVIDPASGSEVMAKSRGSVWCPITEDRFVCTCKGHTIDECTGCNEWETITIVVGNEYCGSGLGEGEGSGDGSGGNGDGTGGSGDGDGNDTDLPIDGPIITKPLFNADQVLNDCLGYHNSAHYDVLLLDVINNSIHVDVKSAMANYLQANGCSQETTDTLDQLVNYLIEGTITKKEAFLTLASISTHIPWNTFSGNYNGISSLGQTHKRQYLLNSDGEVSPIGQPNGGIVVTEYKLANGDRLATGNYNLCSGCEDTVFRVHYKSKNLWYEIPEPTTYTPLSLDFLWEGFWTATQTTIRYATPLEDIVILIEGRDFDGVEQSRAVAAGFLLLEVIPGSEVFKLIKVGKYGDEVGQLATAAIRYVDNVYKAQKKLIDDVLNGLELLTNNTRRGNFGEIVVDVDLFEKGYSFRNRTNGIVDLDDTAIHTNGIDHIIQNDTGEFFLIKRIPRGSASGFS